MRAAQVDGHSPSMSGATMTLESGRRYLPLTMPKYELAQAPAELPAGSVSTYYLVV